MPNITLIRDHLFEAIGKTYTEAEFDELCFEFGVEVDDVATEVVEVMGHLVWPLMQALLIMLLHCIYLVYWRWKQG